MNHSTPREVTRFAGVADTLGVGAPGKRGRLRLRYALGSGRTELVARHQEPPLQIMRPLYCDPAAPEVPVTYLMSTGGGIVQSDRLHTHITVDAGAQAVVTTQAATTSQTMDTDYGETRTLLETGPGAVLEFLPDPLIPHRGTRVHQGVRVTAGQGSLVMLSDILAAGRLARGEIHAYDVLSSTVELAWPEDDLIALDTQRWVPEPSSSTPGPSAMTVLDGDRCVGSFFVFYGPVARHPSAADPASSRSTVTPEGSGMSRLRMCRPAELASLLDAATQGEGVRAGASTLPDDAGAWVRISGYETEAVHRAVMAAWGAARWALLGLPPLDLRKS